MEKHQKKGYSDRRGEKKIVKGNTCERGDKKRKSEKTD